MSTLHKSAPREIEKSTDNNRKLTKEQYRAILLHNYAKNNNLEFDINKVKVSKNDPVLSTVNNILTSIK
ncbi:hypothetical protein [Fictibacillus terranigra]|uniref:Uncharacterized protein n=1 Tax=Fictibacillus terranigra TaxID=3058424 RepID=A0ABT8EDE9_9BACL|nr:hypothetical protein [Fictibacillus sp. CENA-BCM004]MDN4075969.1 hypothetical protein [Fictibacillus sp. CENA-BCM004]